jgi:hypothetical protein
MKKYIFIIFIFSVLISILIFLFLLFGVYFGTTYGYRENNYWGKHSRCYYDNSNTQCGKTKYCASHLLQPSYLENNGTWELETQEREIQEHVYFQLINGGKL